MREAICLLAAQGLGRITYHTVDSNLVDRLVDAQEINQIRSEGILTGEPNFNSLGLDKLNDLDGSLVDVGHILAVRVLPQERGGANDDVTGKN